MKKVLVLLISLFTFVNADTHTFNELVKLASLDLNTSIYVDKHFKNYEVDFNIPDYQGKGEMFELLNVILAEKDLYLQYNKSGNFYFIKNVNKPVEPITLPELPLIPTEQKIHYYSYKIRNITNKDVVKVMSIFQDIDHTPIRYTYLQQSDMIAYASTETTHKQIRRMLKKSDNTVLSRTIKITLFITNKTNFKEYGSDVKAFTLSMSANIQGIFKALEGDSKHVTLNSYEEIWDFSTLILAMQSRGLADIVQEPTMLLTNGIKSRVSYVKTIAFQTSKITRKDNAETTTDQLEYRDIGFQLEVLPKIKNNWVFIDLSLISEELLTADSVKVPVTQKITYNNSVKVYKGKPLLLTGLKKTSERFEKNGIPFFSDLPLIGELFKNRKKQQDEQNINILIEVL